MHDFVEFREAVTSWATGDGEARVIATELRDTVDSVVLVEGVSDLAALETLAERRGRVPGLARVCIIPMGGATNIAKYLAVLGKPGLDIRVAGLCDAGEERYFRRALERVGFGPMASREDVAHAGFFVCDEDLEDELIRALGVEAVQEVLQEQGDLGLFRTFQNQPAKRGRALERQLQRFLGTTSGRKEHYASVLAAALYRSRIPRPLEDLLNFAAS